MDFSKILPNGQVHLFTHFGKILLKLLERFFRKVKKPSKNAFFCNKMNSFGVIVYFFLKKGSMWFEPLLGPNFMPNFRKIIRAVSETNASLTDGQTNGRTNGTDSISPFGLQPGTNN